MLKRFSISNQQINIKKTVVTSLLYNFFKNYIIDRII